MLGPRVASATPLLPYSARTRPYSAINTSVRGDTRTVAMGGATIGLGDTFLAAKDNPAGLAMTLSVGDDNYSRTQIRDANVQDFNTRVDTINAGLAGNFYPWGFSAGYLRPYRELSNYILPNGNEAELNVTIQEFRFSAARWYNQQKFALGVSLILGQAETAIEYPSTSRVGVSNRSYAVGATFGASFRLPYRLLLGASLSTPMHYASGSEANSISPIPGFFQSVDTPWHGGVGLGWIPNRFFRADFSVFLLGPTAGAALLRDTTEIIGASLTAQPRFGAAYVFCDFKNLKGTVFGGSYLEISRLAGAASRFHRTIGTEVKPWIFTIGFVSDSAKDYRNLTASINVDIFKALEQVNLIPAPPVPRDGLLPDPFFLSDVGLARPLHEQWDENTPGIDAVEVGLSIPKKIGDSITSGKIVTGTIETLKAIPDKIHQEALSMKGTQGRRLRKDEAKSKTITEVKIGTGKKPRKGRAKSPKSRKALEKKPPANGAGEAGSLPSVPAKPAESAPVSGNGTGSGAGSGSAPPAPGQ